MTNRERAKAIADEVSSRNEEWLDEIYSSPSSLEAVIVSVAEHHLQAHAEEAAHAAAVAKLEAQVKAADHLAQVVEDICNEQKICPETIHQALAAYNAVRAFDFAHKPIDLTRGDV